MNYTLQVWLFLFWSLCATVRCGRLDGSPESPFPPSCRLMHCAAHTWACDQPQQVTGGQRVDVNAAVPIQSKLRGIVGFNTSSCLPVGATRKYASH